jgi:hypothetical protein
MVALFPYAALLGLASGPGWTAAGFAAGLVQYPVYMVAALAFRRRARIGALAALGFAHVAAAALALTQVK